MGTLTLNPLNYTNIYYVDYYIGNDTTDNGTINNPFKSLYKCSLSINLNVNTLIYLGKGTYDFDKTIPAGGGNCKIAIVGQQYNTILNQTTYFWPNSTGGGSYLFTLEIYDLIYTSNYLPNPNVNCPRFKWNFYNVVFKNITDNGYSFFCSYNSMLFYNCTQATWTYKFFRTTNGSIQLYNCYGAFTTGYTNSNSTNWDISNNIITMSPQLDSTYKITNSTISNAVGVYAGDNTWGKKRTILFKDSFNNIYNYNTLNNQYINNGMFDLKNLTDINKNNLYNITQKNNNVNLINQIPSQYNPKTYFKSINSKFKILYFK